MFVQTEITPNPNSLKFLPGKKVSNSGPYEITNKDQINNDLVRNILSVNGVEGIFLILSIFFDAIEFAFSTPSRRILSK